LEKVLSFYERVNVSLTGGWDSRVILSYLIKENRGNVHLYSFGSNTSDDIIVPKIIADKESLNYSSYVLDQNYLDNEFPILAQDTIRLSGGTRNYKRSHYLHAIKKISGYSEILITGIFGDEVFKVGRPSGGAVLSTTTIDFIKSSFDTNRAMDQLIDSTIFNYLERNNQILEELENRLLNIGKHMSNYETLNKKYYAFRFETNLRKYFGNELSSYNDFVLGFSPFTDYDFLKNLSRTRYIGYKFSMNSNNIKYKRQSTLLYHNLVKHNYPPLLKYNSSRGFSMADAATIPGNIRILRQKYFKKKKNAVDAFNTGSTDDLFLNLLESQRSEQQFLRKANSGHSNVTEINTLYYWISYIAENYSL